MKVLRVFSDGDYAAIHFEDKHGGKSVDEIIENPDNFLPGEDSDEYEQWELEVKEFKGDVDAGFVDFIRRDMRTYDDSKHENFWIEGETVKI